MTFDDLGLEPSTLKAVAEAGYTEPTPIQAQAIPVALMGRDIMGIAQTGTGKTASFTLPMIDILASGKSKFRMPRALILCPTRELAAQARDNFVKYAKNSGLTMALLIGGESFTDQEKALERPIDVLIATPGRLLDMFERGKVLLNEVKYFVIDEADRMLDMGFIPDVERIAKLVPQIRQTLFFSATMDKPIRKLADAFLHNPKEIAVDPPDRAASTVVQGLIVVDEMDKREALRRLIRNKAIENAFIFCNRKKDVDILFRSLTKHGIKAVMLHGDMAQAKRTEMLAAFKGGEAGLLVCSDVAARGLDITDVPFVVNFDVPNNPEDYIHRIGRTGRAGRSGHAYTFCSPKDSKLLTAVQALIGQPIPPVEDVPELDELTTGMDGADQDRSRRDRRGKPGRDRKAAKKSEPDKEQPKAKEPRPEPKKANKSKKRRDRGQHDPDVGEMDHDDDVIAFGAHTPSFLKTQPDEPDEKKCEPGTA